MKLYKNCCSKFTSSAEPISSGPEVIVSWWIRGVEPKVLTGFKLILRDPSIIFIDLVANDSCFWLYLELILALIDGVSC